MLIFFHFCFKDIFFQLQNSIEGKVRTNPNNQIFSNLGNKKMNGFYGTTVENSPKVIFNKAKSCYLFLMKDS